MAMAKHFYITIALAAVVAAANLATAEASPQRVVVHLVDYAHTPAGLLTAAERHAALVYERLGITVLWTAGHRPAAAADDGDRHLEVVMLSGKMTEDKCRDDRLPDIAFGAAVHEAQRAVVFFDRAASFSFSNDSPLVLVLALVIAHEMGHLLLPAGTGHTTAGIMQPHWKGQIRWMPDFTRQQGEQIQEILSAPMTVAAARD
jgi:hypothetical protein